MTTKTKTNKIAVAYTPALAMIWRDEARLAGDETTAYWAEVALGDRRAGRRALAACTDLAAYRITPPATRREAERAVCDWQRNYLAAAE